MSLRLIVALLALLLSLPATAVPACHAAPTTAAHHEHRPAQPVAPDAHVCIGCAALGDWLRAPLAERIVPSAQMPAADVARLDPGGVTSPALPPPRVA